MNEKLNNLVLRVSPFAENTREYSVFEVLEHKVWLVYWTTSIIRVPQWLKYWTTLNSADFTLRWITEQLNVFIVAFGWNTGQLPEKGFEKKQGWRAQRKIPKLSSIPTKSDSLSPKLSSIPTKSENGQNQSCPVFQPKVTA